MASQVFWPLISQKDRNRLYQIEFDCGIFPKWFYDRDPNPTIENLSDRQKIRFLRGVVSLGREWIKEVQEDFTAWVSHAKEYRGQSFTEDFDLGTYSPESVLGHGGIDEIDVLQDTGGRKTAQEVKQEELKNWMDCYHDTKRILIKAERTYFRLYAKNISKSEPLGDLGSVGL